MFVKQTDTTLPCTPPSSRCVCSLAEVNTHGRINQDHTSEGLGTQQALDDLCEEYENIFSLHQGDTGHTELLTMDIGTRDYFPIVKKSILYTKSILNRFKKNINVRKIKNYIKKHLPLPSPSVVLPKMLNWESSPKTFMCRLSCFKLFVATSCESSF